MEFLCLIQDHFFSSVGLNFGTWLYAQILPDWKWFELSKIFYFLWYGMFLKLSLRMVWYVYFISWIFHCTTAKQNDSDQIYAWSVSWVTDAMRHISKANTPAALHVHQIAFITRETSSKVIANIWSGNKLWVSWYCKYLVYKYIASLPIT